MPDGRMAVGMVGDAPTVAGVPGVGDEPLEDDAVRIAGMLSTPLFFEADAIGPMGGFVLATLRRIQFKDRQLRHATSEMKARNDTATHLQHGLEVLHAIRTAGNHRDGDGLASATDLLRAGVMLPSDGDVAGCLARLNEEYDLDLSARDVGGTMVVESDGIDSSIQELDSRITRINTSTELDMIHLQSTLESRSNEFRVISQILNGEHDTLRSVIGNIG